MPRRWSDVFTLISQQNNQSGHIPGFEYSVTLDLSRKVLSSSPSCRFIPAHTLADLWGLMRARTCARPCHQARGELQQIQFLLGHMSVQTRERYLGMIL
jgi:hypothetical protein